MSVASAGITGGRPFRTVGDLRGNDQSRLSALTQEGNALVPAGNDHGLCQLETQKVGLVQWNCQILYRLAASLCNAR